MSRVDFSKMTDEELEAVIAAMAIERTLLREDQNAAAAEYEIRKAMSGMSGAAREAMALRLEGGVKPSSGE